MRYILLLFCLILFPSLAFTSQINPITLEEMEAKSEYILLGKVSAIKQESTRDKVTVEVRKVIKGKQTITDSVSFWLSPRGLKDFDPELKLGDSVVAFLTKDKESGEFKPVYWGSVAILTKPNYL